MRVFGSFIGQSVGLMVLVMAICLTSLLLAANKRIVETLEANFIENSVELTGFLASQINTGTRLRRSAMIEPQLDALLENPNLSASNIRVTHVDGIEVANKFANGFSDQAVALLDAPVFNDEGSYSLSEEFLTVRMPITLGAGNDAVLVGELAIAWDTSDYLASAYAVTSFLRSAIIATSCLLMLTTAIALYLIIGRPLSKTVTALTKVSNGEEDVQLPRSHTTEIRGMIEAIEVFLALNTERLALLQDLSSVMASARKGDFSVRVDIGGDSEDERNSLRHLVNELLSSVDAGIRETVRALEGLSQKDLTVQMDGDFEGSFGKLSDDMNRTAAILRSTVSSILETAQDVKVVSHQLSSSAGELSQRTQHNAAMLEETSSSITLVSGALATTAQIATNAKQVSDQTKVDGVAGKEVIHELVEMMNKIHSQSERISEIVSLIDDVAFQTNLLALNAGVEAARAGAHGTGFAVVAAEVRSLAQRTAESAGTIKSLVSESGKEISNGVRQAAQAGASIEAIVGSISDLSSQISEISDNARDQSVTVTGITTAVTELDRNTQQNAAMVDDTSRLALELRNRSNSMADLLHEFDTRATTPTYQSDAA